MQQDIHNGRFFNAEIKSGRLSHIRRVMNEALQITQNGAIVNFLDPNGAGRNVDLPANEEGLFYVVSNIGVTFSLTVRDAAASTISTVGPGETSFLFSSKTEWRGLKTSTNLGVFTNTIDGLVPAPNSAVPGTLFLRDDGQWGQIQVIGIVDAFKYISDGTNIAVGAGPDTFTLRSSSGKVGITVTNNEAVFGDNANLTVNEASVDHNLLLNYSANRHVDHTAVTMTAGLGLSGGGAINAPRTFDFAPTELTAATPALTDFAVWDLAAGGPRKALWSAVNGVLNHNALLNYVADQHIAHSGVSMIAGIGISGGGDITTSRTFNLDFTDLPTDDTITSTDLVPFYDVSEADHGTNTFAQFNAALDHNALANYVTNRHIDHSAVSITAGTGLTGGGDITTTRTINLDPTTGTATLNVFTSLLKGLVPASGGGSVNFLRADGTWVPPAGGGDMLTTNNLNDVASKSTSRTNLGVDNPDWLDNGNGQVDQPGATTLSDKSYGHDQWFALVQTASVAKSTQSNVADGVPTMMRLTQSQASAQRMGYAQTILGSDAVRLRGHTITFGGKIRCSSSQAIRVAIVEWTGTIDAPNRDVVNDWTNGTFTTGNFFTSTTTTVAGVAAVTPAAATLTDISVTATISGSANNITFFCWTEGTAAQNVTLDMAFQVKQGNSVAPFIHRNYNDDLFRCRFWYNRMPAGDKLSGFFLSANTFWCTGPVVRPLRVGSTPVFESGVGSTIVQSVAGNQTPGSPTLSYVGGGMTWFAIVAGGGLAGTTGQGGVLNIQSTDVLFDARFT